MTNSRASSKGNLQIIEEHEATGTETSKTFTFTDFAQKWSKLILEIDITPTGAFILQMQVNTGTASYYTQGSLHSSADPVAITSANASQWQLGSATLITTANANVHSTVQLYFNNDATAKQFTFHAITTPSTEQAFEDVAGYVAVDYTTFTSIKILASTSSWKAGSKFTLYGLKR